MRVNTTDLQNAFGKYLALAEKEDIVITKNSKSIAKLIAYTEPDYFLLQEEAGNYKATKRISYEEYLTLVSSSDRRYELIDGEIYLIASPGFDHQVVVNEIAWHFNSFFRGKPCQSLTASFDIRLCGTATRFEDNPNVVQPDVIVICDQEEINEDNKYEGIPALIVEVLSPSTKTKDMVLKLNLYMKSGVSEYWIIDIEHKRIIQYSFTQDNNIDALKFLKEEDQVKSTSFEGLEIPVKDIFTVVD